VAGVAPLNSLGEKRPKDRQPRAMQLTSLSTATLLVTGRCGPTSCPSRLPSCNQKVLWWQGICVSASQARARCGQNRLFETLMVIAVLWYIIRRRRCGRRIQASASEESTRTSTATTFRM